MPEISTARMLGRAEVAEMIGVSPKTLREWERAGRGPEVIRFSPKVARYPADAVTRFVKAIVPAVAAEIEARR